MENQLCPKAATTALVRQLIDVTGWTGHVDDVEIRMMAHEPGKSAYAAMTPVQKMAFDKVYRICSNDYRVDPCGVMTAYINAVIDGEISSESSESEEEQTYNEIMECVGANVWRIICEEYRRGNLTR